MKITICQLGGMFEIENKMVVISHISSIPDCVSKRQAPVVSLSTAHNHTAAPIQRWLYKTFIHLVNHGHIDKIYVNVLHCTHIDRLGWKKPNSVGTVKDGWPLSL